MEGLLNLIAGAGLLLILAVMATWYGVDSRDGFGGERATGSEA